MNSTEVETLLREWIGLDAATIGPAAVRRAMRTRMEAIGCSDPALFAARLRADVAERDRLVEEVIVAESWFFRDRQVFRFLADYAVTRAALKPAPVRILCAPCAAGEEPYSVAMALLDAGLAADRFVIDAVDVSRVVLEKAARGRYSANAFRDADLGFRDRWFRSDGGHAVIADRVRGCVHFARANLLDDAFAAGRTPYDVVFCRNLLIYLAAEARTRLERTLDRLLAPDGILVLGAAEPPILKGDWIPAGETSVFALRRGVHLPRTGRVPVPRPGNASAPAAGAADAAGTAAAPKDGPTLEEVLERAGALANARRHAEALEYCERHRRTLPPAPELFFLMGMLHQAVGDVDRAEGCLHKTLYLDAGHEEALLALALLARARGDLRMADAYRQSAARVLARKTTP